MTVLQSPPAPPTRRWSLSGVLRDWVSRRGRATRSGPLPTTLLDPASTRRLLTVAARRDVSAGGCFSAGPEGIEVWSSPFTARAGQAGSVLLGRVEWHYEPSGQSVVLLGATVTAAGRRSGATGSTITGAVLALSLPAGVIPAPRDAPVMHPGAEHYDGSVTSEA